MAYAGSGQGFVFEMRQGSARHTIDASRSRFAASRAPSVTDQPALPILTDPFGAVLSRGSDLSWLSQCADRSRSHGLRLTAQPCPHFLRLSLPP